MRTVIPLTTLIVYTVPKPKWISKPSTGDMHGYIIAFIVPEREASAPFSTLAQLYFIYQNK